MAEVPVKEQRPAPGQLRATADDGPGLYLVFGRSKNFIGWDCLIIEEDPDYPADPAGGVEDIPEGWMMSHTVVIA